VTADNKADNTCKSGTLYLVDLAGSEDVESSKSSKMMGEAIAINKSLTMLRRVIQSLTSKNRH